MAHSINGSLGNHGVAAHRRAGAPAPHNVAELAVDEFHVLKIARLFFEGIATPQSEAWMTALVHAELHLSAHGGARLAYGVLAVVQGLRTVRPLSFRYMQAGCPRCSQRLTEDERHFILAYRALREDAFDTARRHLTILTLTDDHQSLASSLSVLGQDFAPIAAAAATD